MPDKFVDHVAKLKNTIHFAVHTAVVEFKNETGITPTGIDIDMLDITTHGDRARDTVVGSVKISFDEM